MLSKLWKSSRPRNARRRAFDFLFLERFRKDTCGGVLVYTGLMLPVLLAVSGMAVDGSLWLGSKRSLQATADVAALSATLEMARVQDETAAKSAALVNSNHKVIDIVEEIDCLALNIYFEARGEFDLGKIAVGHVVLNRVADTRFPETVCAVVRQGGEKVLNRCQFSWWCDGRSDSPRDSQSWGQVKAVARKVYWGFSPDPTAGSLWYHAAHVSPSWAKALARGPKIGQHLFYSDDTAAGALAQASFTVGRGVRPTTG